MPSPPDSEPVIAPSVVVAIAKLINGLPGISIMKSEIIWKLGANVMTTPNATEASIRKIGLTDPSAPILIVSLCDGIYRWKTIAEALPQSSN